MVLWCFFDLKRNDILTVGRLRNHARWLKIEAGWIGGVEAAMRVDGPLYDLNNLTSRTSSNRNRTAPHQPQVNWCRVRTELDAARSSPKTVQKRLTSGVGAPASRNFGKLQVELSTACRPS